MDQTFVLETTAWMLQHHKTEDFLEVGMWLEIIKKYVIKNFEIVKVKKELGTQEWTKNFFSRFMCKKLN